MTGAGLLPPDKYHVRKFCQDSISALDLSDGEFSSISELTVNVLVNRGHRQKVDKARNLPFHRDKALPSYSIVQL
jgi:hypothetical protein